MPEFGYKALNQEGERLKGWAQAPTPQALRILLHQQDLTLLSYWRTSSIKIFKGHSLTHQDMEDLFVHLSALYQAGFPLADCFESYTGPKALSFICQEIARALKGGSTLVETLSSHPKIFDRTCLCVLGAAQKNGALGPAFEQLCAHYKWRKQIGREMKKALLYPLFLMILVSILLGFLMSEVVPQLNSFLSMGGGTPSWSALLLKGLCLHIKEALFWSAAFMVFFIAGTVITLHTSAKGTFFIQKFLAQLPLVGPLWQDTHIQRFTQSLSLMIASGVPLLEALQEAALPRHKTFRHHIDGVIGKIQGGNTLTQALTQERLFPASLLQLCALGEKTGRLDTFLARAAHLLEQDCNRRTQRALGILEPAALILVGGLLVWIVCAFFVPLYEHMALLER
jgi:type II secretory pathway component PulF